MGGFGYYQMDAGYYPSGGQTGAARLFLTRGTAVIVGERISKTINPEAVVEGISGEFFADHKALMLHRPLDVGRLFYVKLLRAFDPSRYDIEVIWDHRHDVLHGSVTDARLGPHQVRACARMMKARTELNRQAQIARIDHQITEMQEEVRQW